MAKLIVAALLLASLALVSASSILYARTTVPSSWSIGAPASAHARVEFTLALKQRNLDILDKWFTEVSDPTHKNYQDFKSIDEINDLVSPKPEESAKVLAWLKAAGVHHSGIKSFGDAIDVATTVKHAARLFNTKFHVYAHKTTGAKIVRQFGSYSIPAELKDTIEMVTGISSFPVPHLTAVRKNNTADEASNDYGVVPQTLDELYQISQSARKMYSKAHNKAQADSIAPSQAVIEFQGQNFAPSDLAAFGQGVDLNVLPVPASQIIGPNDPTQPQDEPSLDIQMLAGVSLEQTSWFWLENGNGWLYTFAVHFFGTANVPLINSISYGWYEADQCTIGADECASLGVDSTAYVQRVNVEFQKIGSRGISLLASSGDSGANGRTDRPCTIPQLRPSFPASSPYVTAVGATELVNTSPLNDSPPICGAAGLACVLTGTEQAVSFAISGFASGGGFSSINPQPAYQAQAVANYLKSGVTLPPSSYFTPAGRGYPDVSAIGHNLLVVIGGAAQPAGGTSASTPIFAGVMALLNAAQLQLNGKPLGFLNPLLYQMQAAKPSTFTDVTVGDNKCTENGCAATCQGYECAPGWDPVTGLGTPNFAAMLAYVQAGEHMTYKSAKFNATRKH